MKRIRIVSALFALAVLAALAIVTTTPKHGVRAVYASSGCTDATLTGNYVFTLSGFTTRNAPPEGQELPITAVGVFAFDGAGNISARYTVNFNGKAPTGQTSSGSYAVNSDCSASFSFTRGDDAGYAANMEIIGGGTEMFGIPTQVGDTQTFDAKKQ